MPRMWRQCNLGEITLCRIMLSCICNTNRPVEFHYCCRSILHMSHSSWMLTSLKNWPTYKIFGPVKISRKFVPEGLINNIPALVQVMAWCRPGTSHYLNQWELVYRRIYASLGRNQLTMENCVRNHHFDVLRITRFWNARQACQLTTNQVEILVKFGIISVTW